MQLAERFKQQPKSEQLTRYIAKRYSRYGYSRDHGIAYNREFTPEGTRSHYRWVENVSDGVRLVGAAHEIIRLQHTGWYIDNFQDEVVKGMVYQLPSRNGECQYVPAVDDPCNKDCACLDFHSITDSKEDAARWADSMAEQWAETEREYQAKESERIRLEEIEAEIKEEFADSQGCEA